MNPEVGLTQTHEELVQAILDASPNSILAVDALLDETDVVVDFTYVLMNRVGLQTIGRSLDEIRGKRMTEVFPGIVDSGLLEAYKKVWQTGQPYQTEQKYNTDGVQGWFLLSAVKRSKGLLITVTDTTAAHQLTDRHIAELEQANQYLRDLVNISTHDLQEPLRKIQVFSSMLGSKYDQVTDEEKVKILNKLQATSQRISNLIRDVVNYSSIKDQEIGRQEVALNDVVVDVLADFELVISDHQTQIHVSSLPTIWAIPGQMTQLFSNLIGNALKYSAKNTTPVIEVGSRQVSADEITALHSGLLSNRSFAPTHYYEITVADNGIGFDPIYAGKIFSVFQRLVSRNEYEGNGIGLAICKRIVDNHRGAITARSQPGEGSTFFVYLPASTSIY